MSNYDDYRLNGWNDGSVAVLHLPCGHLLGTVENLEEAMQLQFDHDCPGGGLPD